MQANATGDNEIATSDLGPLAWVLDELRKSLDGATKALRRFVRDAELARGSDLAALDASQLRIARQQLHQAVGALEMVGMEAPAKVLRAMEALAQKFVQRPEFCSEDAANKVERASFALTEYLDGVLKGKTASPVALFPQYRDLLELVGEDRIHPADLWPQAWRWIDMALPYSTEPSAYDSSVRARIDGLVLKVVKSGDVTAAKALRDICLGFAAAQSALEPRVFWKIGAAYFEAVSLGLCPSDVYGKRAASRILLQYRTLARGEPGISERLVQDLLFFCAQAVVPAGLEAPVLAAVRSAYGLNQTKSFDYQTAKFGLFDPALLVQARKRIAAATETWSALAGGDTNRLKVATDQFSLVADSVLRLHPASGDLARELTRAMDATARSGEAPPAPLAMEVATAVLYLEAAYEDMDPTDSGMTERSVSLAKRLAHVNDGGNSEPLEAWMEELYRRVSDRQIMGSVVDELRTTLGEVENSLDSFFRSPLDKSPLHEVPSKLAQMRGVFSVLGLDQAALASLRMRDSVEKFLVDEIDVDSARTGIFEKLGNSLGALGFLIDMLSYQRALAKKLFVYDEDAGEFKPLMGREKLAVTESVIENVPEDVPVVVADVPEMPAEVLMDEPHPLPEDELPVESPTMSIAPVPVPVSVVPPDDDDVDMKDIFLEEAREVVQTALSALMDLSGDPADLGQQTTLRRGFHTLKGSSRMVGLNDFGEAAWAMEQLLNAWLAEQKPASEALIHLADRAMHGFNRWIEDIATGDDAPWQASVFREAADHLRLDGQSVEMVFPGELAPATLVEPVAPELEVVEALLPELELSDAELPVAEEFVDFAATQMFDFDATQVLDVSHKKAASEDFSKWLEPSPATEPIDLGDFDFGDFAKLADLPPEPVAAPVALSLPALEPLQEVVEVEESLTADAADVVVDAVEPPVEPELLEVPPVLEDIPAEAIEPEPEPEPEPELAQDLALDFGDSDMEDQIKVIGGLRIDIALYNVYLNEADEWSRRLLTELSEWSMELHRPVSGSTVALAHSLAGSSATVGFMALSGIARALEQALMHVQLHAQGVPAHAKVFIESAEDIRRLLHQFAAGFLKEPDRALVEALKAILETEFPAVAGGDEDSFEEEMPDELDSLAELDFDQLLKAEAEAEAEAEADTEAVQEVVEVPVGLASPPAPYDDVRHEGVTPQIDAEDDDIDAVDALDVDLFPIFEEEALELMPQLGGALRQWMARPDNLGARNEVLRVLHTLKGSARLAGAMHLGEMTHRMESAIEYLGLESLAAPQMEPLLTRFDAIQANFDQLRAMPEQALSLPEASPSPELAVLAESLLAPDVSVDEPVSAPSATPIALVAAQVHVPVRRATNQTVRVRSQLLDRLVNQAGEVMITRSRLDARVGQLRGALGELTGNLDRLRNQLRDIELQSESQMQSRLAQQAKDSAQGFDPLEFDRFTRVQELTRMMAESVHDVATLQRNLQRTVEGAEDDLIAQGRQARELQRDLLRTRMVEFEGISERLYGVVRQAAKEAGKQVKLDIIGGSLDMDRGVLDRMTPAFEHLLRNAVAHGIEEPALRVEAKKPAVGTITIHLQQQSNDVIVEFSDDGAGLDLNLIRQKALAGGALPDDGVLTDAELANLIFTPGFTTASQVTELSGRGIGMDVVRSEVNALGGRIETATEQGQGTRFKLVLPLTTAVTQVVMLRMGDLVVGVPANLVEMVRRAPAADLERAYQSRVFDYGGEQVPFFWVGALLQASVSSSETQTKTLPVAIFRSAGQRVAVHVDEVLGNQEVVVKNLGPQLSRLPGLTGMSVLASGAVVLIYNPVALSTVYGEQARQLRIPSGLDDGQGGDAAHSSGAQPASLMTSFSQMPLVLVVDDSITVRRVTQRLLKREGFRVALAADGLQALERLQEEKPAVVLSDIEMPRMDGFDLARNIRGDSRLRDLPIIMITSRIAEKHRDYARELGVDHYLGKPYSEDELIGLVRHYCSALVGV